MPRLRSHFHPNAVRQVFFLALLIGIGLLIFKELYFLIGSFLGAVTLYVILLYPLKLLTIKYNWPSWLAALLLMIISLVIMILPLAYMTLTAIDLVKPIIDEPNRIKNVFDQLHDFLQTNYNIDVFKPENVAKITDQVIPFSQRTLGSTLAGIGNIVLMYLVLYFLLVQTRDVEQWIKSTLPLKSSNAQKVISEVRNLVYSNALGIPIVAIVQGIIAALGYSLFGVDQWLLLGILTAISSVIPILGTMLVYLPLSVYQYSTEGLYSGIGVLLWGFLVIGSVDNIARFMVQRKLANVHPLITLLGVFMGVKLFGFLGIIFGPLLLSIFFLLTRIYVNEFGRVDANQPDVVEFNEVEVTDSDQS
jgi:predicted PurR-regulated permease PerM